MRDEKVVIYDSFSKLLKILVAIQMRDVKFEIINTTYIDTFELRKLFARSVTTLKKFHQ